MLLTNHDAPMPHKLQLTTVCASDPLMDARHFVNRKCDDNLYSRLYLLVCDGTPNALPLAQISLVSVRFDCLIGIKYVLYIYEYIYINVNVICLRAQSQNDPDACIVQYLNWKCDASFEICRVRENVCTVGIYNKYPNTFLCA